MGSGWTVVHIGTEHSPNLTGEEVPEWLARRLPDQDFIDQSRRTLGAGSAEYKARVEGLFPDKSDWALVEPDWLARAVSNEREPDRKAPVVLAVDPGSGGDPTVAVERRDDVVRFLSLGRLARSRNHRAHVVYDSFGVGAEFGVHLARAAPGSRIVALNSGDRQMLRNRERREYFDPRAVMAWKLMADLEDGTLRLPDDPGLSSQILELRQVWIPSGLQKIEPKADMKDRIGRSPDELDALLLSGWIRPADTGGVVVGRA